MFLYHKILQPIQKSTLVHFMSYNLNRVFHKIFFFFCKNNLIILNFELVRFSVWGSSNATERHPL